MAIQDSGGATLVVGSFVKFTPSGLEQYDPTTVQVAGVITAVQTDPSGSATNVVVQLAYTDKQGIHGTDQKLSNQVTLLF